MHQVHGAMVCAQGALGNGTYTMWNVEGTVHNQGGGKNAIRIFSHFPHFFSHFLGRSLSVMFKRIHSSGIV